MANNTAQISRDWLANGGSSTLAWWAPKAAIVVTLFAPIPVRATVWMMALVWIGTACILNARRCGRTHCRYTGPYYLAMIPPVLVLASGIVPIEFYSWAVLGALILVGSWIIWWATERAWGKFS